MINKTIWALWCQGQSGAPDIVKECLESWRRLNPGWRLIVLDARSVSEHLDPRDLVDPGRPDVSVQVFSNVVRLGLLRRHGGVWADATVYCARPLDAWLPAHMDGGFFAFRDPGKDRMLSNWFLAATHNSYVMERFHRDYLDHFQSTTFTNQGTRFGERVLRGLRPHTQGTPYRSRFWLTPFARRILRVYPYYVCHYTFNRLALSDPVTRRLWALADPPSAKPPHRLRTFARRRYGVQAAIDEIDAGRTPMYKLKSDLDYDLPYWRAVLGRLRSRTGSPSDAGG